MFLQKHLRILTVGVLFGALALFSCAQKNPIGSAPENNGVGKAVVQLPDLSSSGLKKLPVGIDTNALTLLIVGPGMDTIKYSWPVTTLKGQTVTIDGIPAGSNRIFEGFLTNKSGVLTHSGKVIVNIVAGQDVPVNLKLSGTGSADVCIEIEGYPSACSQNDSLFINNCLSVSAKSGNTDGSLKLYVYGNTAAGTLTFTSAKYDSSEFYEFDKTIKIVDSVSYKYFYATVYERTTKIRHSLYMIVNQNLQVVYGILSKDTTLVNNPIAKFYYVKCSTPGGDTIAVSSCIGSRNSSESITGHMSMTVYNKSTISGAFNLNKNGVNTDYYFSKLTRLIDSANITCISAIINVKQPYGSDQYNFSMYLDKKSQNWVGIIYNDSLLSSKNIEIQSVTCSIPSKDTMQVLTAIGGHTPSSDSVEGRIKMFITGDSISGYFYLYKIKDHITFGEYDFKRILKSSTTPDGKFINAITVDEYSKKSHYVELAINNKSEVTYGYLSQDSVLGDTIAKFKTISSESPFVDTTYFTVPFSGSGEYPDTVSFTGAMTLKLYNGNASGYFQFSNWPLMKNDTIPVAGILFKNNDDGTTGGGELTSVDTSGCYNKFILKYYDSKFHGDILQMGSCGQKTIAHIESQKVIVHLDK